VNESEIHGYTVAYGRDEIQFPVYVIAVVAAALLAGSLVRGSLLLFCLGIVPAAIAYYNTPLIETGRPRIGANEYGLFVEGLGVIAWRAIGDIKLVPIAVRFVTVHELQIALTQPITKALFADWRRQPWHRLLMRLPWSMTHNNVIRINLEPFDKPPDEVHRTLVRMWRYYRS
jgi:hypothetical protein